MLKRISFTMEYIVPEDMEEVGREDLFEDLRNMGASEFWSGLQITDAPDATLDDVNEFYLQNDGEEVSA